MIAWLVLFAGCAGSVRIAPAPVREVAASRAPTQARAAYLRGQIWLLQGDVDGAMEAFATALTLDPDSPWIRLVMGEVALDRGDVKGARAAWQAAVEVDADCWEAGVGLAHLDLAEGHGERALHRLAELAEAHPNVPALAVHLLEARRVVEDDIR